jgi:hypothetical protein
MAEAEDHEVEDGIPSMPDTGVAGTQAATGTPIAVSVVDEKAGYSQDLVGTIQGLAAARPRSMGGEMAAQLLAAGFKSLDEQLKETKADLKIVRGKLEVANASLAKANQDKAVLGDRLETLRGIRHLNNLMIAIGTLVLSFGGRLVADATSSRYVGFVLLGIGLLMILIGWFSAPPRPKP